MLHLLIHWLDDLRSQGDSTFSWNSVKGNIGAMPYQATLTILAWPALRRTVVAEIKRLNAHLKAAESEAERIERDLLKPLRWTWAQIKKVARVRVTVKK